jgi:nucleotide-binding universal stress UspA family protein
MAGRGGFWDVSIHSSKKRILVGTDFGTLARSAASVTVDLAKDVGAEVVLAHALPLVEFANYVKNVAGLAHDEVVLRAAILEGINRSGQAEAERVRKPEADVRFNFLDGHPSEALCTATERNFDLLVLGSCGQAGVKRLLLGSVAEALIRHAPVPVLVIRSRAIWRLHYRKRSRHTANLCESIHRHLQQASVLA